VPRTEEEEEEEEIMGVLLSLTVTV